MALFEQLLGYMLLGSLSYAGGGGSGNQTTSMAAISLVAEGFIWLGCKLLANANPAWQEMLSCARRVRNPTLQRGGHKSGRDQVTSDPTPTW